MSAPHDHHEPEDHDRGLAFDLPRLISRRAALGLIAGGAGSALLSACGGSSSRATSATTAATGSTSATTGASTSGSTTTEIPEETAGPYPGDGSNGPNALTESGVVRQDLRSSFGGASGTAEGVPLRVAMTLLDVGAGGGPLAGAAVYLWHCDRSGRYSMYDAAIADQNYLRGVQASDDQGAVTFTTIFPAAYMGRWPHIHFEVYESIDAATSGSAKLRTSQIALPQATCDLVYATAGYEQSVQNLQQTSLQSDMVFSDGYASQLATASGSVADGIAIKLNVGV